MAPLPDNNTGRLWIRYTAVGREHDLMLRFASSVDAADAAVAAGPVVAALKAIIPSNDAVTGARFSAEGSNVSFPVTISTGAGSAPAWTDADKGANFASWSGRSADGRDVKYTVFMNMADADTAGYRLNPATNQWLDFLDAIQEMVALPRTISGQIPFMNPYVNFGYNAYWQRKLRRGG